MGFIALERMNKYIQRRVHAWQPSRTLNIGIHGFGMIGKSFFIVQHYMSKYKRLKILFINDRNSAWRDHVNIINCPSVYGETGINAKIDSSTTITKMILPDGSKIDLLSEPNQSRLPLKDIDILVDTSGDSSEKDKRYFDSFIEQGAKRVIIPNFHSEVDKNIILGFNEDSYDSSSHKSVGCGSCSLNLLVPVLKILSDHFKLGAIVINVMHAANIDQSVTDVPHSRTFGLLGRCALNNFMAVPSASLDKLSLFFPELDDRIAAFNTRIPVPVGMAIHSVIKISGRTSESEVNNILANAANGSHNGLIRIVTKDDGFSSSQTAANPESAIIDISQTRVLGRNQISILGWQDPYLGYSVKILDTILWITYAEENA